MDSLRTPETPQASAPRLIARLLRRANHWREERRLVTEHADCVEELDASGDLESFLEAIGASREELSAFAISPLRADHLLDSLMSRIGVAREELTNVALDDLRKACHCCGSWKQCRRWLVDGGDAAAYRQFCPNARALERLATQEQ